MCERANVVIVTPIVGVEALAAVVGLIDVGTLAVKVLGVDDHIVGKIGIWKPVVCV